MTGAALTRGALLVDDRNVGYRTGGAGPVIAVVGPLDRSGASSEPLLARLARIATVVAVDPPGHGLSDPAPTDDTIEARASRLDAALTALGVTGAVLVGRHSGGLVALQLAWTTPSRYRAVILDRTPLLAAAERRRWAAHYTPRIPVALDGSHIARHWMLRRLELLYAPWFDAPDGVPLDVDLTVPDVLEHELHDVVLDRLAAGDTWAESYRATFAYDPAPALGQATVPIAVLGGEGGGPAPSAISGGAVTLGPTVRTVDVGPDTDHDGALASVAARLAPVAEPRRAPAPTEGPDPTGERPDPTGERPDPTGEDPDPTGEDPDRAGEGPAWVVQVASTPWGQIVARRRGPAAGPAGRRPLVMFHASPLSGMSLLDLGAAFAATRPVIVLDTLGSGDSDKPDRRVHPELRVPRIGDYAAAAGAALDDLAVGPVDLYGTHTGALIATELAVSRPELVANLVLNGVPLFSSADVEEALGGYFLDMAPRWDGAHLVAAWSFTVEVMLWYPWHTRSPAHRRARPNLDPDFLHRRFVQLVKGGTDYADPQRAALVHPTARRLDDVRARTLVCSAPGDPLAPFAEEVARRANSAEQCTLVGAAADAGSIAAWLDAGGPPCP